MKCNIDKRGQTARYAVGIIFLIAGCAMAIAVFFAAWSSWLYIIAASMMLGGVFGIFEASTKWCAVRAMGFRTPI